MSLRSEKAIEYFKKGYNCSQAVVLAFCDVLNISEEYAAVISSGFGGGMGRLREVCGAVSGMVLVANMLYAKPDPTDRKNQYSIVQELAGEYKKFNGSIVCRELLGLSNNEAITPVPERRTNEYYKKRPCPELIGMAAEILENYISNNNSQNK